MKARRWRWACEHITFCINCLSFVDIIALFMARATSEHQIESLSAACFQQPGKLSVTALRTPLYIFFYFKSIVINVKFAAHFCSISNKRKRKGK